jgi:tyrosyl-tRNA synthetase
MKNGDGMSFAEFSYPLLQAWDWWHMYKHNGVQMQIGGSDQYGNITAGIDAIQYISATHPNPLVREEAATRGAPFGFTVPLLTTSSGQKFGKSAGNAIWLDLEQTTSFELYKFFLGTPDADVGRYLKLFTFIPIEQIDTLVEEHMQSASQRKAQHTLAREFVELVHGEKEAKYAELQHRLIYAKNIISPEEYAAVQAENAALQRSSTTSGSVGLDNAPAEGAHLNNRPSPHVKLPRSAVEQANIGRILLACGLVQSSTEGHHLADVSAVHVGGFTGESKNRMPMHDSSLVFTPIKRWEIEDAKKYMIDDSLLIFRRGKHNIKVIEVVPDSEYEKLGLTYPGVRKRISEGE